MDLKRMQYFCTIAEQGQISRAARVLNIAQPPLSQRMRELEEELGCALFIREGRSMRLTPAGELFHRRAREILSAVEAARDDVVRLSVLTKQSVRLGLSPTCRNLWLRNFQAVRTALQGRQIGLVVGDSSYLEYLLQTGQLDIALMQPPLHPENFIIRELQNCPSVAVAPRGLLNATAAALSLQILSQHPLLLLRRSVGIGTYERIMYSMREAGLTAQVALYSSDVAILLELLPRIPGSLAIVPQTEAEALEERYTVLPVGMALPENHFSLVCLPTDEHVALLGAVEAAFCPPATGQG